MSNQSSRGNVLYFILIGVVLFAALNVTVMRSNRISGDSLSQEKARLAASQIIRFAAEVEKAVSDLRLANGCDENEISYFSSLNNPSAYDNAAAPPDYSCHVFHPDGGGVIMKPLQEEWLDSYFASIIGIYGEWAFTNINNTKPDRTVVDIGTSEAETQLRITALRREVCMQINDILKHGWGNTIPVDPNPEIGDDDARLAGKMTACRENEYGGDPTYQYYQVLVVR